MNERKISLGPTIAQQDRAHARLMERAKHGAAVACATATSPRPSYDEAVKHRPPGSCYCDLDDRACYMAGHWEPICKT
jgi:hypothetical protein